MLEVNKIYLQTISTFLPNSSQYPKYSIYFIQTRIYFQKLFHSENLVISEIL